MHRACEGDSAANITADNLIRGECDLREYAFYEHDVFGQMTQSATYHEPGSYSITHALFQYSDYPFSRPLLEQHYTQYQYDAAGRRMKVSSAKLKNLQRSYNDNLQQYIYNWQEGGVDSEQTNYRYNGEAIYLSYKPGNSITSPSARWLQGSGIDEPLIRYGSDGSITNYHQDGRNSAVLTTSANDGAVIATQRFDAFGNQQAANDSIAQYGFTGREQDASGLMYYRARYYDPSKGRFTQRDPKGYIDGINQYAYVRNNPVNRIDPNGTVSISTNNYRALNNSYHSGGGGSSQTLASTNNNFDAGATADLTRSISGDTSFLSTLGSTVSKAFTSEKIFRAAQVVGGAGQVALGAALCSNPVTCIAGGAIALKGVDNIQSAVRNTNSFTQQGITAITGSERAGTLISAGLDLGTSVTGLIRSVPKINYLGNPVKNLFFKDPTNFESAFRQAGTSALAIEGFTSAATIYGAKD